jgi:putative transposase
MRFYENPLKLPQLGWVKFRNIQDGFELRQARIVRGASEYLMMLSRQLLEIASSLDQFCEISDSEIAYIPHFLNQNIKLLKLKLKNKQKGSNNRYKLNQKIARLYRRISNPRKDWHFKLVPHLCNQDQSLFLKPFENIDFRSWGKRIFSKDCLEDGFE